MTARVRPLALLAAALVVLSAPALFVLELVWLGGLLLAAGLGTAWLETRRVSTASDPHPENTVARTSDAAASLRTPGLLRRPSLLRDLSLVAIGLVIVRTIPLAAKLDTLSMVKFTLALGGAVLVPYLVSRFVYRDRATRFPWRGPERWGRFHWAWIVSVIVLGWLILPFYFISSGVYSNWPTIDSPDLTARLFIGVGAVGIWDELFFICTVFAVMLRHFPSWLANILQAVVFVSFLWELGYRSWGPILTIPFALVQGIIFLRTKSLTYVVTVHLIFDAVVFAVLVHAHNPAIFNIFPTAPAG